jgi:hypothetical protein
VTAVAVRHHPPSDKAAIPSTLSTKVTGLTFEPDYPRSLHWLAHLAAAGCPPLLVLAREPDNPYDSAAVAVRSASTGRQLGHLPGALAGRIAPELDAGGDWRIESYEVLVQEGFEDRPGLSLRLKRHDQRELSL